MSKPIVILLASALAAATAQPLPAWGALGHQMAATASVQDLPPELAAWFLDQTDTLHDHANDPDHWKQRDPLEGPRHYLDCEAYGSAAQVPVDEDAAQARLGPAEFQHNGQVPWVVQAQSLAKAFTRGDRDQVALEAAILSHYVADLSVPLHTSSNHDGAKTGQHGVHRRWESNLLERIVEEQGWSPEARPAQVGPDAWNSPFTWLVQGFDLVPRVLADDLTATRAEARREPVGASYWRVFQRLEEPVVKEQLTLAAQRTAEMVTLAWTRAGMPPAPAAATSRASRTLR